VTQIEADPLLPGFRLPVAALFEEEGRRRLTAPRLGRSRPFAKART
jgi:hypothetical protein